MGDDTKPTGFPSLSEIIESFSGSRVGKGAAMGALMGQLLSSYKGPGGVNKGVDMSKVGQIAPRTTNVAPPRYIPYSQYSAMDEVPRMSPEMMQDFGVSSGTMNYSPLSAQSYDAMPAMQSTTPRAYTSAGSGSGVLTNPTLTPRSDTKIGPLTGALLGSAIGYLTTPSPVTIQNASSGGAGGGTGGNSVSGRIYDEFGNIISQGVKKIYNWATGLFENDPASSSGKTYDFYRPYKEVAPPTNIFGVPDYSEYYTYPANTNTGYVPVNSGIETTYGDGSVDYGVNNATSSYYKEGGMATPLMAEGGEVPHYYTYGKPVNPQEVLAGMAKGGEAQKGGLPTHVPTIEGRHDYRSGSRVSGDGDGTSDDIPAMLADGEYVFSADVVSALGNGSTKAGADRLDYMVQEIRARDRSTHPSELPPDSKSPLQYLQQSRSKKNG